MSVEITPDKPGWIRKLVLAELLGPPPALVRRDRVRGKKAPPTGPLGAPPSRR